MQINQHFLNQWHFEIVTGTYTIFATHFTRLAELAVMYPSCKLWQFEVGTGGDRLDFTWKLKPSGATDAIHYGILLAQAVGIDEKVCGIPIAAYHFML